MESVKMFLFARWIATCYADERVKQCSVLNIESGAWWKDRLQYFEDTVYPNYIVNGMVKETEHFLN